VSSVVKGACSVTDFTLPELGENITAGDVLKVLIQTGDTIAMDQAVLELETDKATIEVPSSVAGQVKEIKVKAGDKVKVGTSPLTVRRPQPRPSRRGTLPQRAARPRKPRPREPRARAP
jgi:pyruvate dehydrogenase E2 component (dihydrolipoamide acetyltransferase)